MTRRCDLPRLRFNIAILIVTALVTGGCGQVNSDGKLNPGGCDGPNKYSVDAQPNGGNDAGS